MKYATMWREAPQDLDLEPLPRPPAVALSGAFTPLKKRLGRPQQQGRADMIHIRNFTLALGVLLAGPLPAAADSVPVDTQGSSTAVQEPARSAASKGNEADAGAGATTLGIDILGAGSTADSNKAFFQRQSPDQQAQIRRRCDEVMTTGSVANADQPGGSSASTEGAAPKAGGITTPSAVSANVLSFCTNIK
jgi:hypothetical protein